MSGKELEYIERVFESNYIAPLGEFVDKLEKSICDFTDASHCLCVNTATSAIHLALRVLGVGQGDVVLSSSFTFIGSVAPVMYEKATPYFIDCDESWNLSPALLEQAIEKSAKKPKALILTHLYGQIAQIEEIADICRKHGIYLIEDCAESLGGFYKDKHCGLLGDFGVFSFNGNKIITASSGGALICNNAQWAEKAKYYSTTARENEIHYEHLDFGYNYRMSNVLAAIGVAQMEVLTQRVQKRREIFAWYQKHLRGTDISFMPELPQTMGNRWLSTIDLGRDYLPFLDALQNANFEARPLWKPMHLQPVFKDAPRLTDGTSEKLFAHGLCLPSGTQMEEEEVVQICDIIKATQNA